MTDRTPEALLARRALAEKAMPTTWEIGDLYHLDGVF